MQDKTWYSILGLDAEPLFLQDHMLSRYLIRSDNWFYASNCNFELFRLSMEVSTYKNATKEGYNWGHFWVDLLLLCCCTHPIVRGKKWATWQSFKISTTCKIGTLGRGGSGHCPLSNFLGDQLTLSQPGMQIMPTILPSASPLPDFQTFRGPWNWSSNAIL